jgi:hypothetical protein
MGSGSTPIRLQSTSVDLDNGCNRDVAGERVRVLEYAEADDSIDVAPLRLADLFGLIRHAIRDRCQRAVPRRLHEKQIQARGGECRLSTSEEVTFSLM